MRIWLIYIPCLISPNQATFIDNTQCVDLSLNGYYVHDPKRVFNQTSSKSTQESIHVKYISVPSRLPKLVIHLLIVRHSLIPKLPVSMKIVGGNSVYRPPTNSRRYGVQSRRPLLNFASGNLVLVRDFGQRRQACFQLSVPTWIYLMQIWITYMVRATNFKSTHTMNR